MVPIGAVSAAKAMRRECHVRTADPFTGAEFVALNLAKATCA